MASTSSAAILWRQVCLFSAVGWWYARRTGSFSKASPPCFVAIPVHLYHLRLNRGLSLSVPVPSTEGTGSWMRQASALLAST
jgi:hypothetical protein